MSTASNCDSKGTTSSIPVVVVESHQHVLEHVHAVLRHRARLHSRRIRQRQKGLAGGSLALTCLPPPVAIIHFDSHPDLACPSPSVPARACFEPRREWPVKRAGVQFDEEKKCTSSQEEESSETFRNLYEHLDMDRSGIAQWILPLVLSGDLDFVHWVRSAWADQIQDGLYRYSVGAWVSQRNAHDPIPTAFVDLPEEAIMKVDFRHKYYYEDNTTVAPDELILPKELTLYVSELPATDSEEANSPLLTDGSISDDDTTKQQGWILDICLDYFLCRNPWFDEIDDIDAEFAAAFVAMVEQARFSPSQYQHEYEKFQQCMTVVLRSVLHINVDDSISNDDERLTILQQFYEASRIGESLFQRLTETANKCSDVDRSKLVQLAIDALPSVTLPHDRYVNDDEALKSATMQIEAMEAYLRGARASSSRYRAEPMMITVARSTDDGFTPKVFVDILQRRVLGMVQRVFCRCGSNMPHPISCKGCCLNTVFDYGEWEGSELDLR
eukprot:CAMPEP_0181053146 /NCGR_PEP_ID=MMETSP1070-20121207/17954_1 /TAXON_ID=265543 /ORGANISM="Minutocellus polymorphus, Strain NH13" /LENGTH=498 /DNA_ID=CAMNT_0023132259 /DNA_START=45 /DNA_END=1541 /DNA_ORIENTATION=-